jgi:hypothetical protein
MKVGGQERQLFILGFGGIVCWAADRLSEYWAKRANTVYTGGLLMPSPFSILCWFMLNYFYLLLLV